MAGKSPTTRAAVVATLVAMLAAGPAMAGDDCTSAVSNAQDQGRQAFIQGMAGLASNNFSTRPGSFSSMACLDKFMQGNMDIMFKPPSLNDLLGQVMNFACQAASSATGSSNAMGNLGSLTSLIGSLSGGLNLGGMTGGSSGTTNLGSLMGGLFSGTGSSSSSSGGFESMFGSASSSYGSGSTGYNGSSGTMTYPNGQTGSANNTPGGGGYSAQGTNPGLDSKLLQGHSITLPSGN